MNSFTNTSEVAQTTDTMRVTAHLLGWRLVGFGLYHRDNKGHTYWAVRSQEDAERSTNRDRWVWLWRSPTGEAHYVADNEHSPSDLPAAAYEEAKSAHEAALSELRDDRRYVSWDREAAVALLKSLPKSAV